VTFVTLECVRARVWLLPSLRSVGACVWPWLPERVVVLHIPCVLTYKKSLLSLFLRHSRQGSTRNYPLDTLIGK
jgi:hypothetical protein